MSKRSVILAVNAGSSSVKATVFEAGGGELRRLASAQVAGLTSPPAKISYAQGNNTKESKELPSIKSQDDAFHQILDTFLSDKNLDAINGKDDISYVCHRVVHGGDYKEQQLVTQETYHHIEALEDLAPLHNASAVTIIKSCLKELPNVKNVASFDSAFHQTMPEPIKSYAIDQRIAQEKGLRKYGFHGISYSYILRAVSKYIGKAPDRTSVIALHLGSGASACAIRNGKSLDTSMGLTPVSGLPGGSRSGDIDPSLIFHYTSNATKLSPSSTKDLHITEAEDILNKQSGWKALTGTADFSKIASADAPESHKLAFEIFIDRIVGFIGSYFVKLDGTVDALVFAGGIGEKSALLRQQVTEKCSCLGFTLDKSKNNEPGDDVVVDIGKGGGGSRTLICQTDEEYEMAYACITNPM